MKKYYLLLCLIIIELFSSIVLLSQNGAVYYFSLFPGQVQGIDTVAQVNLLSGANTKALIEKGSANLRENINLFKNQFSSFNLTASEAQPITQYDATIREHIIQNAAIKVTVEGVESANCIIRTKYGNNSDGMMVLEKSKLGNNYQITNPPSSTYQNNILTNFALVVGIYDNTRVTFRMGGCETCYVMIEYDGDYLKFNQTIRRTLNEGDVWIIPAIGPNSVLTGSTVKANKPVAVFSGSNSAYSVQNNNGTNYTISQELPEELWGKSYLLPNFVENNIRFPTITAFAKNSFTDVYANGLKSYYITYPGGIYNSGYKIFNVKEIELSIDYTAEISSDKSINVLITDPNLSYTRPVQLQVLPTEHFSNTATFNIENIIDEFVNVIYKTTKDGKFPQDLLISEYKDEKFNWIKLSDFSFGEGNRFNKIYSDSSFYRTKIVKFQKAGTYFIKSDDPIAVYHIGIGKNTSFGFPVNGKFNLNNIPDTLAPIVEYTTCCLCKSITGKVTDQPGNNPEIRSNLAMVFMASDDSYNANFTHSPFIAGIDASTNWELKVRNHSLNMRAHLVFIDKAGNRKDTIIECPAILPEIKPYNNDFGIFNVNKGIITQKVNLDVTRYNDMPIPSNIEMYLILDSDSTEAKEGDINTNQYFGLGNIRNTNISPLIANNKTLSFEVKFESSKVGKYKDSVGVVILSRNPLFVYYVEYFAELSALIGDNFIEADDFDFGAAEIQKSNSHKLKIFNPIKSSAETALDLTIDKIVFSNDEIGFKGSGKPFEVDLPNDISNENPIVIHPDSVYEFDVTFIPKESKEYNSEITFLADTKLPDRITKLKGSGLPSSVTDDHIISSKIDIITESGQLKFKSDMDLTIDEVEIYDIMGKLVLSQKVNQSINGYTIETTNFTHNVYIVKMLINNNWISKKVII